MSSCHKSQDHRHVWSCVSLHGFDVKTFVFQMSVLINAVCMISEHMETINSRLTIVDELTERKVLTK